MGCVVGCSTEVVASKVVHPSKGLTSGRFPWIIQWGNTVERYRGSRPRKHLWVEAKPLFLGLSSNRDCDLMFWFGWLEVSWMHLNLHSSVFIFFKPTHPLEKIDHHQIPDCLRKHLSIVLTKYLNHINTLSKSSRHIIKIKLIIRTRINSSSSISASEDIGSCLSSFNQWSVIPWKNLVMLWFWYRFFNCNSPFIHQFKF